jgi:AcrR family transcriptional regulator
MVAKLTAAAHSLLDADGPDAITVRKVAAAADVAPMNIYNHFGSKDGVVDHLVMDGFAALREALLTATRTADPMHDLLIGCRIYRSVALARPNLYAVMFSHAIAGYAPSAKCLAVSASSFEVLVDGVRAAERDGVLVAGDSYEIAERLWACIHGLVTLEMHGYGFVDDRSTHFDNAVQTMLRGLSV